MHLVGKSLGDAAQTLKPPRFTGAAFFHTARRPDWPESWFAPCRRSPGDSVRAVWTRLDHRASFCALAGSLSQKRQSLVYVDVIRFETIPRGMSFRVESSATSPTPPAIRPGTTLASLSVETVWRASLSKESLRSIRCRFGRRLKSGGNLRAANGQPARWRHNPCWLGTIRIEWRILEVRCGALVVHGSRFPNANPESEGCKMAKNRPRPDRSD
jgi:hypothetical protein